MLFGIAAYGIWGVFPLYFQALAPASAWEILGHRIVWTAIVCVTALLIMRDGGWVRPLLGNRRVLAGSALAGVLVATNWVIYIAAVNSGHVTDAALGYFLNPIITVALGVVVLRETLRPLQWVAVALGLVAALYLAIQARAFPVIALSLAVTFALYSLTKKRVGVTLPALPGLAVETVVLLPVGAALLGWIAASGASSFAPTADPGHTLLLASTGVVTAVPLLAFAAAARRVPLVTIGLLQFLTPVLQLLCGVLLLGEHMAPARWVGFALVWGALVILTIDSIRTLRTPAISM